ncbi:hypothetical protein [Actinoplanes sp. NPDC020271]
MTDEWYRGGRADRDGVLATRRYTRFNLSYQTGITKGPHASGYEGPLLR